MIWYLILNFTHGGTVVIPEPSQQQCQAVILQLKTHASLFYSAPDDMFCVPGLQSGVLQ